MRATPRYPTLRDWYFGVDGYPLSVEHLARYTILVEGGYTTPEVEARRMLRDRDPKMVAMGEAWLLANAGGS